MSRSTDEILLKEWQDEVLKKNRESIKSMLERLWYRYNLAEFEKNDSS